MADYKQTITFDGTEENHFYEITSDDVEIISSPGNHELGCSKVTLKNVIDFNWEHKLYVGHVVAVHMLGKHIAYGIKAKSGGMVRIIHKDLNVRGIIKGLVGQPQDLAFAHIEEEIILASVDEEGNLFVHSIESPDVSCVLKLHIPYTSRVSPPMHRVIWCPYIPEPDSSGELDEDIAKLLVVTHGPDAVMVSVNTVFENHGPEPLANGGNIVEGILELVNEHTKPITDAMFAPDGTAIATTSSSGEIKFFQVYMHVEKKTKPRCLHQWQPHDGKPVSCIFFLDNHKNHNPTVQYWKFAITGCNNNSELKLWSCQTWSCLQTIVIRPNPNMKPVGGNLTLKASMDRSSQYLILSDIYNRIMYIMQIIKSEDETQAFIKSVSEFLLPCSILSFDVVETGLLNYSNISSSDDLFELQDVNFDNEELDDILSASPVTNNTLCQFKKSHKGVFVKLFLVQPKSLQECRVIYHPQINYSTTVLNMMNSDTFPFTDDLADVSVISNHHPEKSISNNDDIGTSSLKDLVNNTNDFNNSSMQQSTPIHPIPSHINLMTPEAFNNVSSQSINSLNMDDKDDSKTINENTLKAFDGSVLQARVSASPTIMNQKFLDDLMYLGAKRLEEVEAPLATSESLGYEKKIREANLASGGSSPSREVQEILSLKDSRSDLLDFDLIDNGDIQETADETIPQTIKTVVSIPSTNAEPVKEDKGWPCPPKIDAMQVNENLCNTSTNSIGSSNVFQTYTSTKNTQMDENQSIANSLEKIFGLLSQQSKQIQNLQLEMNKIHENEKVLQNIFAENNKTIKNIESSFEKSLEQAIMKNQLHQTTFLESVISKITSSMKSEINHTVSQTIMQILNQQFIDKFSTNCTIEIQQCIIPSVVSSLENLKQAIQLDMSQKLSTTDHLLQDHIMKLAQNKHTIELLTKSLLIGAQTALNNTLKTQIETSLVPSFERATNQMFRQMHETFSQGTKDYLINFELTMEKNRRQVDKSKDLIFRMDQLSDNLKSHSEATNSINKHIYESVAKTTKILQDNLIKNISEHINLAFSKQSEELEDHLRSAVRSNAVTPALQPVDSLSYRAQINEYLRQKDISSAFQHALMASDLTLVVYVCEKVDPSTLFKQTPCPLPQNVLLSLIQQLSADLLNHSELKHRYLEEALMNLDTENACIKEHIPVVLRALKKQLLNFVSQYPENITTKRIRMLSMVTDSLLTTVSLNNTTTPNKSIKLVL